MIAMAVIGCGRIGRMHAINLARHPKVKLVAVYDTVAEVSKNVASELHVEAASSVNEVLSNSQVQAVLIATPTPTHISIIGAAVRAGKAVLCEKPIDLDIDRAQACWQEISSYDPIVMIGFNRRFDPSFRALRERLHTGEIGNLEMAVITSRDPAPPSAAYIQSSGGLLLDMTIHDFDMARYLAGEIVEVHAYGANLVDPMFGQLGDIDSCAITLRAASGALIQINNTRRCVYGYDQRIEVFGSKGMLRAGNHRATSVEASSSTYTAAKEPVLGFFIERYQQAYNAEVDAFVSTLARGSSMEPGFPDALAAQRLALAAMESIKLRRVIEVAPANP